MEIVSLPRWSRAKQSRCGVERAPLDGRPQSKHVVPGSHLSARQQEQMPEPSQCPVQVHTSSSQTQPQASQQQPCLPCVWFSPRPSRRRLPTFAHIGTRCSAMPDWHQFVGKHVHLHVVRAIDLAVSLESASPAYAKLQTSGSEPVAGMRRQAHVDKTKVPIRDG